MFKIIGSCLIAVLLAGCALSGAQTQPQSAQTLAPEQTYSQPALDQMLAPIALYPDPLLSQILMGSTYPLEVVQAARWSNAYPQLEGDDAVRAVVNEDWDPSVKSLVAFPRVLAMMDERLDWTEQLGEAFLAQESQVLDTVQALRQRAYAAGNLRSNPDVRVTREGNLLVIDPVSPQLVYVPYYDPWVVYGRWWWPMHPPVGWAPWPGDVRPGVSVAIHWGGGIRLSTGFFYGALDWHRHRVNVVHVTNYYYRPKIVHRAPVQWRHEPVHRRGHAYRDAELSRRYSQPASQVWPRAVQRREAPKVRRAPEVTRPRAQQRREAHDAPRTPIVTKPRREQQPSPQAAARRDAPRAHDAPNVTRRRPQQRPAPRTAQRREAQDAPRTPIVTRARRERQPSPHAAARRDAPRTHDAPNVTRPRPERKPAPRAARRRDAQSASPVTNVTKVTKSSPPQPSELRSERRQRILRTEKQPPPTPAAQSEPQPEGQMQLEARPETARKNYKVPGTN